MQKTEIIQFFNKLELLNNIHEEIKQFDNPILTFSPDNWSYQIGENLGKIRPKRFNSHIDYKLKNEPTQIMTLTEVLDRIESWYRKGFRTSKKQKHHYNNAFQLIHIMPFKNGYLWCDVNAQSHIKELIDKYISFDPDYATTLSDLGLSKDYLGTSEGIYVTPSENVLYFRDGKLFEISKGNKTDIPLELTQDWYESKIKELTKSNFDKQYPETLHGYFNKIIKS